MYIAEKHASIVFECTNRTVCRQQLFKIANASVFFFLTLYRLLRLKQCDGLGARDRTCALLVAYTIYPQPYTSSLAHSTLLISLCFSIARAHPKQSKWRTLSVRACAYVYKRQQPKHGNNNKIEEREKKVNETTTKTTTTTTTTRKRKSV